MRICAILFLITTLFYSHHIYGQDANSQWTLRQESWQQRVDVNISVSLDVKEHLLRGLETIEYTNHSTKELTQIPFLIYPNAYKNHQSQFAQHFLENGNTNFYFAHDSCLGWMDSLDFKVDGKKAEMLFGSTPDVIILFLPFPIKPEQTVIIQTPFRVKIPCVFSRMGRENNIYCITQWFPKPAVFDARGWEIKPYLDQGEFYSEFGNFKVDITVPDRYIVAASGLMENQEEWIRLKRRDKLNEEGSKTLTFRLKNTHDFAWFASPDFVYTSDTLSLNEDRKVILQSFEIVKPGTLKSEETLKGKEYIDHIRKTLMYRSDAIGNYEWPSATVVQGPLVSGGGMEYPTITVIPEPTFGIVEHEVGHNWFYGMLGSDEREFPWMDEGLNTYYDERYAGSQKPFYDDFPLSVEGFKHLGKASSSALLGIMAGNRKVEMALQPANWFTSINYGTMVYGHMSRAFAYLEGYLGTALFDSAMKIYFQRWKFKHPLPGDFKGVFEEVSGQNLDFFFNKVLPANHGSDLKFKKVSVKPYKEGFLYTFKIDRKGYEGLPIPLANAPGEKPFTYLKPGADELIISSPKKVKKWVLDPLHQLPEVSQSNNSKGYGIKFRWMVGFGQPDRKIIGYTPVIGYNYSSGWMPGIYITNELVPAKNIYYRIMALYGTRDQSINGSTDVGFRAFWKYELTESLMMGVRGKKYAWFSSDEQYQWFKIEPYLDIYIRPNSQRSLTKKHFHLRYMMGQNTQPGLTGRSIQTDRMFEARFEKESRHALHPWHWKTGAIVSKNFSQFQSSISGSWKISKKWFFQYRAFAAGMAPDRWKTTVDPRYFLNTVTDGYRDYMYDGVFINRTGLITGPEGLLNRQTLLRDGAMKLVIPMGGSDRWMSAINLQAPIIPGFKLVKAYFDAVAYSAVLYNGITGDISRKNTLLYSGGLSFNVFGDAFSLYFPLIHESSIREAYRLNNLGFKDQIMFHMTLRAPINENLMELLEKVSK